jgi:hypothetical protein
VYTIVQELDPELRVLAQEGSKGYQERFDLIYLREVERPNIWWQSDHCWLNIWLLDENGRPARPFHRYVIDAPTLPNPGPARWRGRSVDFVASPRLRIIWKNEMSHWRQPRSQL